MAELQVILGGDQGKVAIQKLDNNIKAVNLAIADIDITDKIKNSLTETVPGNALDAVQGKALAEQISILTALQNGFKFYASLAEINPTYTIDTPIATICDAMQAKSVLFLDTGNNTAQYPITLGFVTIFKLSSARCRLEFSNHSGTIFARASWHTTGGFSGWKTIATTDKIDISTLNGWTNLDGSGNFIKVRKVGSMVSLAGILQAGVKTDGTLVASLPIGYRPINVVRRILKQYNSTVFKDVMFEISVGGALTCYYATDSFYLFDFYFSVE